MPADLLEGLTAGTPYPDTDSDGIDDAWETAHGLDPSNGGDHDTVMASGYTAIEEFLDDLSQMISGMEPPPVPPDGGVPSGIDAGVPSGTDAGVPSGTDAGRPDAAADGGRGDGAAAGCGCRAVASQRSAPAMASLAIVIAIAARRRRRL